MTDLPDPMTDEEIAEIKSTVAAGYYVGGIREHLRLLATLEKRTAERDAAMGEIERLQENIQKICDFASEQIGRPGAAIMSPFARIRDMANALNKGDPNVQS